MLSTTLELLMKLCSLAISVEVILMLTMAPRTLPYSSTAASAAPWSTPLRASGPPETAWKKSLPLGGRDFFQAVDPMLATE